MSQIREDSRSRPGSRVCRVWNKEGGREREGRGRGKGEEPAWWWFVHRVAIARQNPGGPFGYVMYQPNSNPARKWGDLAGVDVLSARVLWTCSPSLLASSDREEELRLALLARVLCFLMVAGRGPPVAVGAGRVKV